jgi:hypothetical protein
VALLLQNMNERPGLNADPDRVCVMSSFGGSNEVKTVSVGRVLDTLRSRRNAILESYVNATV